MKIVSLWAQNKKENIIYEEFEQTLSYGFFKSVEKKLGYSFKDKSL